jgi:DNA modification methylase
MQTMTPLVADSDFTLYLGDVRQVLAELESESVHCVVTSPPYWGLRDYGTGLWEGGNPDCDHRQSEGGIRNKGRNREASGGTFHDSPRTEDSLAIPFHETCGKCGARRVDQQLGLEPTPDQYIHNMVSVFREVRRVLRRDGTLWLNIGDSYASGNSGQTLGSHSGDIRNRTTSPQEATTRNRPPVLGMKPKDLCGIPWRLAFALQQDGWYLRSEIIWAKSNPMPESVTDRPTKSHEQVFLLTRSPRYFYDADAVREPHLEPWRSNGKADRGAVYAYAEREAAFDRREYNPAGRNLRSVWEIPTEPFPQAHFATYPQALVERCVRAGTSEHGCCPECGAPWVREVDRELHATRGKVGDHKGEGNRVDAMDAGSQWNHSGGVYGRYETKTTGWRPTCECRWPRQEPHHYMPVPCTVFDPFIGSGTTALVARRLGRKCVGIELSPKYAGICLGRTQQLSLLAT